MQRVAPALVGGGYIDLQVLQLHARQLRLYEDSGRSQPWPGFKHLSGNELLFASYSDKRTAFAAAAYLAAGHSYCCQFDSLSGVNALLLGWTRLESITGLVPSKCQAAV